MASWVKNSQLSHESFSAWTEQKNKSYPSMKNKKIFFRIISNFKYSVGPWPQSKKVKSSGACNPTVNNMLVNRPLRLENCGEEPTQMHPTQGPDPASKSAGPIPTTPSPWWAQLPLEQDPHIPPSHQLFFLLALPSSWLLFSKNAGTISRCHCQIKTTLYLNIPV